jgi:DNA-binding beta-propeller fold protein YncE
MRRLLPLLTLALLAGCSNRERDNPFDPRNPNTHGGPAGFVALADDGRVDLEWTLVTAVSFSGYRLYRQTSAETTYRAITGLLPPSTTRYSDVGLLNGLTHYYRLVYVFPDVGERGMAEDVATPGAARPWVADAGTGQVLRLTPDGRHVSSARGGFSAPSAIATDVVSGWVWISDHSAGSVAILNPWTGTMTTIPGLVGPSTLTVDPVTHNGWVCDENDGTVYEFTSTGSPASAPIDPLQTPIGVAVDPNDGSVWIAERAAGRLRHYANSHALLGSVTVDRPSRVAVDSLTSAVWATSFESRQMYRVSSAGVVEKTITGFGGPIGVAVDSRRGRIWVADALADQVLQLDRAGTILGRVAGISEARDISIDSFSGDAWVVAPGSGEVVRISSSGVILARLAAFSRPVGIAVDPGVR